MNPSPSKHPFVVGLTGGIGSGKSAVSDSFAALGIDVVDADVIARQVVEPGTPALQAIVAHFGQSVLTSNGQLDRAELRKLVFANEAQREWLNNLLHPAIRDAMSEAVANTRSPYCILAVPLLIENGLDTTVDRVLVVDCPVETQVERALMRDGSDESTIRSIIASQASRDARLAKAQDVIDNSGTREALLPQVNKLHLTYLEMAAGTIPAR